MMESKNKTITDLNKKVWYRAIKAVYIFSLVISLFMSVVSWFMGESGMWEVIIAIILIAVVVRGTFYYIVLGTINPEK